MPRTVSATLRVCAGRDGTAPASWAPSAATRSCARQAHVPRWRAAPRCRPIFCGSVLWRAAGLCSAVACGGARWRVGGAHGCRPPQRRVAAGPFRTGIPGLATQRCKTTLPPALERRRVWPARPYPWRRRCPRPSVAGRTEMFRVPSPIKSLCMLCFSVVLVPLFVPGKSMLMGFHRLLKIISRKYADFIFPIKHHKTSTTQPFQGREHFIQKFSFLYSFQTPKNAAR